ncbi:hypothetical protein PbJCM13498_34590 [Prolixibacter bellariivorans]|uniref:Uncharacterized protein n=1 Tax=Prolixibacter bellariivorans TaxID=314319 RepID=A0A5M4B3Z3_9BACT|nr:hypothetical protein [Prolixibacter bellariivorans]GET34596.1 hypothetical protein PbJCM13498_34590 [Prolixibacter bellariivorans]
MAIYIIISVILVVVTGFFFAFPSPKKTYTQHMAGAEEQTGPSVNRYHELRKMAIRVTPELVEAKNTGRGTYVYGIVMDWDAGDGMLTVASYQSGDASLYLSSGGGIISGGQHRKVRRAVLPFVRHGQLYFRRGKKTETTLLPDKDCVGFYFLTNKGTYYAQEELKNIEYGDSQWRKLFDEGNKVLTRLRQITGKKD